MRFVLSSPAKLNVTLRVTSKRQDGYHDLVSIFQRIASTESLRVTPREDVSCDCVRTQGMEVQGENIVARALRLARAAGFLLPFFEVEILKNLFPGTGLGAGSGNGAALLQWLASNEKDPRWEAVARGTGADVPFLFSNVPLALVSGTGDQIDPLKPIPLSALVVFPDWDIGTKNAYSELDERCNGTYPMTEASARDEAEEIYKALAEGRSWGLLPNDFAPPLLKKFPGYRELFTLFEELGSSAWGITGSGGAAFALFSRPVSSSVRWPAWVRQVLPLHDLA